jgi:hypothetical protein
MENDDFCLDFSKDIKPKKEEFDAPMHVFHNLMPFKVREILLVSSLYDAFIVEEEGLISEMVIWEYRHLLLSSPPRVTRVTSGQEALSYVKKKKYDLVITMSKNIGMDPYKFGRTIKKHCTDLPVIILATDTADLHYCQENISNKSVDKAFFWYGDTSLFLAIIKNIEDNINVAFDTVNGNVQIILVIEDSIRDYSNLLPVIYNAIVKQTRHSISDDLNEMQRILRRKARPKILLTDNYEDGMRIYKKYKNNILGIISDVEFHRNGKLDSQAGCDFISYVKKDNSYIPATLQSNLKKNKKRAEQLGVYFIHKLSPNLKEDFHNFLISHLGFGDFIFLQPIEHIDKKIGIIKNHIKTKEFDRASNLTEFEKKLQEAPLESIQFHSERNDFSKWLMARGEFKLANKLRPQRVDDFKTLAEMREYLVNIFNESRRDRQLGVMTDFSKQNFEFEASYTKISGDSLGGKGRGIAFIRTLISRYKLTDKYKDIKITVPSTVAIGTDEFDNFIEENNLHSIYEKYEHLSDNELGQIFLRAKISKKLRENLSIVLQHFKQPLAIRSSSLLEDSQNHPFAGMYSTYMLPNNQQSDEERLNQLCNAIKLVYASVFFSNAQVYIEATSAKIEEEKMAVIIQELVGSEFNNRFYPTFSGVAQSYNFYPTSHQERDDGIVSLAVGLGYSVVGGEKVLRFSPKYPEMIPDFSNPKSIMDNSQKYLYVLNMKKSVSLTEKEEENLEKISIMDIRKDDSLKFLVSTYDPNDGRIRDDYTREGPLFVTFAGILKYNAIPLASILSDLMKICEKSLGSPVEIEFAVNIDPDENKKPVFSIIQIRPFIVAQEQSVISWDLEKIDKKNILLYSNKSLGNGIIQTVKDIVYIPVETFDSTNTVKIAEEVSKLNKKLEKSSYILIGPGRWGTQDRFLGIPVNWRDISNVKVIVETSLKDFNIKPSQGTHFFQNILSKGIGYINISIDKNKDSIDWNWLDSQEIKHNYQFVRHIKLSKPLNIKLDGKKGKALITTK